MKPSFRDYFPVPDLLKTDSLLCIQPHPDDMEIGAGGTLAKMAASGVIITALTVTDGSAGTYDPTVNQDELAGTRREETRKAAALLGIDNLQWLDFADGGNLPFEQVRAEITRTIRALKPATIMVCDPWLPYEAHSDHVRTGMAAAEAFFLSGMPYFCQAGLQDGLLPYQAGSIAFYFTAYPNTVIDVSQTWEKKLAAIACHRSQFPGEKFEMFQAFLTAKAEEAAAQEEGKYAETFKVLTALHMHIFEEAWAF